MDITDLTIFFGWASAINIVLLMISALFATLFRSFTLKIHTKMFGLKEDDVLKIYFQILGQYKILIIVFNLVPYFALRIMV